MITLDKWMNPRPLRPEQRRSFSDAALKAMIIPLMIEQLLQMVVGLADTMMVSYAGEAVVAGVGLDTMRQIESFLVMRSYDGFLKHGRIRGRNG